MGKNKKDSLGDRMKTYENVTRHYLTRRTPVIIRLDGCHFHTFTRGFNKPFDEVMCNSMQDTLLYLCRNIQGCIFGYTQSDEITLIICDYQKLDTAAWFDDNILKMCSVSASLATLAFNKAFSKYTYDYMGQNNNTISDSYAKAYYKGASFDSRVFNIPKEEVCNCLIWRQQDAIRNSIAGLGQAHFPAKQLHKKNCEMIKEMLMSEKNIDWNDTPTKFKRGSCCIRNEFWEWIIDNEIPIFTEDRNYIEKRMVFDE